MTSYFWLKTSADPTCGCEGTVQKELYHTENYKETTHFFQKSHTGAEIKIRDFYYLNIPCDITTTPFNPVVSEKFKKLIERLGIPVRFHKVNVFVKSKKVDLNYYLPEPLDSIDFIDKSSPSVEIRPENDYLGYPGWINHDLHKTRIHFSEIGAKHWVSQTKAFGIQWVVSNKLKQDIKTQELTNFQFWPAHSSD